MAITFTQADLNNLLDAYKTGAEEVQIGDRKIRYRTQAQLLQAIKMVEEYLSGTSPTSSPTTVIQATYRKGRAT